VKGVLLVSVEWASGGSYKISKAVKGVLLIRVEWASPEDVVLESHVLHPGICADF